MKIVRHEEKATLLECLNCGQKGRYPVGGSGLVCVEEVTTRAENTAVRGA